MAFTHFLNWYQILFKSTYREQFIVLGIKCEASTKLKLQERRCSGHCIESSTAKTIRRDADVVRRCCSRSNSVSKATGNNLRPSRLRQINWTYSHHDGIRCRCVKWIRWIRDRPQFRHIHHSVLMRWKCYNFNFVLITLPEENTRLRASIALWVWQPSCEYLKCWTSATSTPKPNHPTTASQFVNDSIKNARDVVLWMRFDPRLNNNLYCNYSQVTFQCSQAYFSFFHNVSPSSYHSPSYQNNEVPHALIVLTRPTVQVNHSLSRSSWSNAVLKAILANCGSFFPLKPNIQIDFGAREEEGRSIAHRYLRQNEMRIELIRFWCIYAKQFTLQLIIIIINKIH